MSYYSAFKIKKTSGIIIPATFLQELKNTVEPLKERLSYLESLSEDEMSVKEYKEREAAPDILKNVVVHIGGNFSVTTSEYLASSFYEEGKYLLYYNGTELRLFIEEGEHFSFKQEGDLFVGDGRFYSSSNYGWTRDMIEDVIDTFGGSAKIKDVDVECP